MPRPLVRHVTRLFAPEVGAAAFRQRQLADAFAALGARVEVLTTRPPSGSSEPSDGELAVSRWPVLRDATGNVRGYVQYLSFDLPAAARSLFGGRPDLYIVEPPPTTGAVMRGVAWLQRRPYVWYAADIWSDAAGMAGAPAALVRALRVVERWILRGAAVVLSVSEPVSERLAELGVDATRVVTVGNGVDTDVFALDGPRVERDRPYFVYAGTNSEWQGAAVFVEALAHRGGDEQLLFIGQGSETEKVRALGERLAPGRVEVLGVVPPEQAACYLRGALAAVVSIRPGIGYDFALPTKIYAAVGCGTPVIFAGDGAARALVARAGLGWGVDFDPASVAAAMSEAVNAPVQDRRRLERWARDNASLSARTRTGAESVMQRVGLGVLS